MHQLSIHPSLHAIIRIKDNLITAGLLNEKCFGDIKQTIFRGINIPVSWIDIHSGWLKFLKCLPRFSLLQFQGFLIHVFGIQACFKICNRIMAGVLPNIFLPSHGHVGAVGGVILRRFRFLFQAIQIRLRQGVMPQVKIRPEQDLNFQRAQRGDGSCLIQMKLHGGPSVAT